MIKRISILIRRPQDTREAFSAHWHQKHGAMVAQLPGIGRYIQNHILEEFCVQGYDMDGFVELFFPDDAAMRGAFAGPKAQSMWDDEPNFLGHSTAYKIAGDWQRDTVVTDAKLIVVAAGDPAGIDSLVNDLTGEPTGAHDIERNDVVEVIPRTTMARGPQPANVFLQLRFADVDAARSAGRDFCERLATIEWSQRGIERFAVTRVVEKRII